MYVPPVDLVDRFHFVRDAALFGRSSVLVPVWDPRVDARLPGLTPHVVWVFPDDPRARAAQTLSPRAATVL